MATLARWVKAPVPAFARVILSGSAFEAAMISVSERYFESAGTVRQNASPLVLATRVKSVA
jgi:hypothetical protein